MRNIFLGQSCTKCGGELFPYPFLKNKALNSFKYKAKSRCLIFNMVF